MRELMMTAAQAFGSGQTVIIGHYRGLPVVQRAKRGIEALEPALFIWVSDEIQLPIGVGESDSGITMSLDGRMRSLDGELETAKGHVDVAIKKIASLEEELSRPWEHEERYKKLVAEVEALNKELDITNNKDNKDAADNTTKALESKKIDEPIDDTEVREALKALRDMHADPLVLNRFKPSEIVKEEPIPVEIPMVLTPEKLANLQKEIEEKAALASFTQAILKGKEVQQDLFADFLGAEVTTTVNAPVVDWNTWAASKGVAKNNKTKSKKSAGTSGMMPMF